MNRLPPVPRWLSVAALVAFVLLLSLYASSRAIAAYPLTGAGDGPFFHEMVEAVRVSLSRFHELPLWNPYQCGGVPLWDNPQGLGASPVVWLMLPFFDTTRIAELWAVVHSTLGFFCMWVLTRKELRMSTEASMLSSAAWAYCGVQAQHFAVGHLVWAPYLYFPLAIFLWRRAETDVRMAIGLGALVALTMHEGALYPMMHFMLILGVETLTRLWPPSKIGPRLKAIVPAGIVVVVVAFSLGASRFLPVMDQISHHTRHILQPDHDSLATVTLEKMFLDPAHQLPTPPQQWEWHEYGSYLGPVVLGLAFVGVVTTGLSNVWLAVLLVWAFSLMLGYAAPYAPSSILKEYVYPFKEMRVAARFNISVTLFLVVFAGLAIDRLVSFAKRFVPSPRAVHFFRVALVALSIYGVYDVIKAGFFWPDCNGFFLPESNANVAVSNHFYIEGPGLAEFIDLPRQNRGRVHCWEEWANEPGTKLWVGDVPQARPMDPKVAEVANVKRTQNTFSLDVDALSPTRIIFDGTFDRGWRTNVGTVVRDTPGNLAVDVPAGHHHLTVEYWPHGLTAGLFISTTSAIAIVAFLVWDARRRRTSALPQV